MKASIVINTYNRAAHLGDAIRSIAAQTHPDVELIVVNGPSTDETESVLDRLEADGYDFKRLHCASRNLSESRNIGIGGCAGDVVMFIDDDGIAHACWVERLMRQYLDPQVAGAGGFTLDNTGMDFQCRYTVCNRVGDAVFLNAIDPETMLTHRVGHWYPSLLGTNSSFRLSTLRRIGGFDEVYAYMLDETDVCLRLYETGHRIVTVPDALVLHKYAPSHSRNAERIPKSIFAAVRSKSYFRLKHAVDKIGSLSEIHESIENFGNDMAFSNRWLLDHGKISVAHYALLADELRAGLAEGIRLATDPDVRCRVSRHLGPAAPLPGGFLPLRKDRRFRQVERPLRICMVSQGYPPRDTAGIARWTYECALGLTDLGHQVHVITRAIDGQSAVDYVDGIWVHSVADTPGSQCMEVSSVQLPGAVLARAEAVLNEVRRCQRLWGVDVVSAPIWDVEGILCAQVLDLPVVTSLHTTYRLALPYKPAWTTDREFRIKHVNRVIAGERWLLANTAAVLANSREIIREIDASYGVSLEAGPRPLRLVYHGLGVPPVAEPSERVAGSPLRMLFVGRIEERKGPDVLLEALRLLPTDCGPVEVEMIGSAPGHVDPYAQRVFSDVEALNATRGDLQVRLRGYVDEATLEIAYRDCDIFVAPSRFESFGLILVEAMRWGRPVVAAAIGGMREIVQDGDNGRLVAPGDSAALAKVLQQLLSDASLRAKLGRNAFATYEARFTRPAMARDLSRFFTEVVAQWRPK